MSLSVSRILSSSITLAGVSSWFVCRFLPLARRRRRRSNATSSWPSPSSSFVAFPGLVLARHLLASGPRCRFLLAGLVPSLRGSWCGRWRYYTGEEESDESRFFIHYTWIVVRNLAMKKKRRFYFGMM
ncbi:uncharacterized protein LOC107459870 isoform X3 [Arachis duranensis]|uniref:Uncharacterized protein LOC107459870 isoform X3 n=1 Tax=Arachis duranensis TaxID=130453 RepID=A0A6P4B836_ARADU|nr:uncharacterized protein LOC107459870 isoform X3 [Arachis duranensis]